MASDEEVAKAVVPEVRGNIGRGDDDGEDDGDDSMKSDGGEDTQIRTPPKSKGKGKQKMRHRSTPPDEDSSSDGGEEKLDAPLTMRTMSKLLGEVVRNAIQASSSPGHSSGNNTPRRKRQKKPNENLMKEKASEMKSQRLLYCVSFVCRVRVC